MVSQVGGHDGVAELVDGDCDEQRGRYGGEEHDDNVQERARVVEQKVYRA